MNIYSEVSCIKGVGPKTANILNKSCIFNLFDLLLYFPRDYEKIFLYKGNKGINNKVIINCKVIEIKKDIRTKTGKILTTIIFNNNRNIIKGQWFNQPYIKNNFKINCMYLLIGKLKEYRGQNVIINPSVVKDKEAQRYKNNKYKILPKYVLRGKLTNNLLIKLMSNVLEKIAIKENLPNSIVKKYNLLCLDKAVRNIHNPKTIEDVYEAQKRLKFQELFTYSLKIFMLRRYLNKNKKGINFKISSELKILKEKIPFKLTKAQNRVIREILIDEKKQMPMNRLVQGDVGSGKTIVAIIAIFNVIRNGYQAVMMAPTEILANQHFIETKNLLKDFNINIKLLSGSVSNKNKEKIKKDLQDGIIDIIIGTHALLEDDVKFKSLGIVVTDEQHRFGVIQRSKLFNKARNVDILVMTATPIPRTLSLCLYGDLDVSSIDELPPGRKKIETYYVKESLRDRVYKFALKQINQGRQVYIVCPLVENNEDLELTSIEILYKDLKENYFKNIPIEILHGKMKPKVKDKIMKDFKNKKIKALVSTTVIEVGVNVPNANLMIIENAERFGLAQLHQLRGRVGRGKYKSYCILISNIKNDIIKKRMEIMQQSNDGFFIAEQDLKIRGSGEVFGFKQHGDNSLILANVIQDIDLFKAANFEAKRLMSSTKIEDIKFKNEIMKKIEQSSKFICFN